jgi:hypothetical protein
LSFAARETGAVRITLAVQGRIELRASAKPVRGFGKSFGHGYGRSEQLGEAIGIEQRAFNVTGANGSELNFAAAVQQRPEVLGKLEGIGFASRTDIEYPIGDSTFHGREIGIDDIADVDVITNAAGVPLLASREDFDGLVCEHAIAEDGDDTGFSVGILTRSIDVGIAENGGVEAMFTSKAFEVFFDCEFAAGVWAERYGWSIDSGAGALWDFPIDCSTGAGENQMSHTITDTALEDIQRADDIDCGIALGFPNTHRDAGLGCLMAHHIRLKLVKDLHQSRFITDIDLTKQRVGWDILVSSAAEIIDNGDLPALAKAVFGQMAANESCTASDQNFHRPQPVQRESDRSFGEA